MHQVRTVEPTRLPPVILQWTNPKLTVCSICDENEAVAAVLERVSQRLRRIESSLEGHRSVLVVGGGIVGASIALQLTRQGCQVCLVEADGKPRHSVALCSHASDWLHSSCPCWSAQPSRRRTAAQPASHGRGSTRTARNQHPIMLLTRLRWSCGANKH